ncbi:flagellin [Metallumcola ferriviriculae]|uniref:flagellin N-terminal helical domain-containing protein n=1 Tax=Metallumcola ferriviriculae TaxID=3039180 RepID=UPI0034599026
MRINTNIAALNAYRQLSNANINTSKSLEKLSSGLRINRAGDDAAGLAISEKMRGQIRGLEQASRNAQNGISLIQTAEGGLNEVHSILQRMRELSDQSANGTNTAEDRKAIQDEVQALKDEIDRIGNTTEFNTQKLLNGNLQGGAITGSSSTNGAVVAKLDSASLSANMSTGSPGTYTAETINVDGTDITVDWQNLTSEQQAVIDGGMATGSSYTAKTAAKDLIISTINNAIDASGKNIDHVSGYVDAGTGDLTMESGSTGTDSNLTAGASGVLADVFGASATDAGTSVYNGATVSSVASADLEINGVLMEVTFGSDITNGDSMSNSATTIETAVNTSIDNYNTVSGKLAGEEGFIEHVTVTVGDNGAFSVNSESGSVQLQDRAGQTAVSDLGLSQAQTEATSNGGMTFQIGANRGQTISFGIQDMRTIALGIGNLDVSTAAGASQALDSIDGAIKNVSLQRSKMGAVQNRLEHTINNLNTSTQNMNAAESRIRDVDMATEMMKFTKSNILSQAATSMLAQANQLPQQVLQLLR